MTQTNCLTTTVVLAGIVACVGGLWTVPPPPACLPSERLLFDTTSLINASEPILITAPEEALRWSVNLPMFISGYDPALHRSHIRFIVLMLNTYDDKQCPQGPGIRQCKSNATMRQCMGDSEYIAGLAAGSTVARAPGQPPQPVYVEFNPSYNDIYLSNDTMYLAEGRAAINNYIPFARDKPCLSLFALNKTIHTSSGVKLEQNAWIGIACASESSFEQTEAPPSAAVTHFAAPVVGVAIMLASCWVLGV